MSLMPPSIVRDLRLEAFGYQVVPMGGAYAPQPGQGVSATTRGRGTIPETLSRFSKTDADAYEDWSAWLARSAAFLGPLLMETPVTSDPWRRRPRRSGAVRVRHRRA